MIKKLVLKKLSFITCALIIVATITLSLYFSIKPKVKATDYSVGGGKLTYDFETSTQLQDFSLYAEKGGTPYWFENKIYCTPLEEQKILLNNHTFSDVEVQADIITLNDNGKFDAGLLLQASAASNGAGVMNGYNVNVEHNIGASTYTVKLHYFAQSWQGIKIEKSGLTLQGNVVKLKAVVKQGILYVFADDMENPIFNYNIGTASGQVGFRNYYAPQAFDNLVITSPSITVDMAELQSKKSIAQNVINSGKYTQVSVDKLNSAIAFANSVTDANSVEEAIILLDEAINEAIEKIAFSELTTLISSAESITDGSKYTPNSYNAFVAILTYAKQLNSSSSEHDIAYWHQQLSFSITRLIEINNV